MNNEEGFNTPEQSPQGSPIQPGTPLGNAANINHPLILANAVENNLGNVMNGNQAPQNLFIAPPLIFGNEEEEEEEEEGDFIVDDDGNVINPFGEIVGNINDEGDTDVDGETDFEETDAED